ncbi:hypothetical protein FD754_022445 [Muntiacus muntjak]|uniref:EF-hand domain-containing protein n=1 Tax=Muntiacus muntjak TaxID=9888 RepID=A0A5N3V8V9_MUNMU|nr:hypothetical protein FD754_022445 [Muntiacus muntjak]
MLALPEQSSCSLSVHHHLAAHLTLTQSVKRPREYLISVLERLRIAKVSGVALPFFMDNSNIASMFEMLDSSNKGSISFVQYKEALKTLGLCTADEVFKDDGHGVTFEKFRDEVNKRTQEICEKTKGKDSESCQSAAEQLLLH